LTKNSQPFGKKNQKTAGVTFLTHTVRKSEYLHGKTPYDTCTRVHVYTCTLKTM